MNKNGTTQEERKLGTFGGVFVPNVLTILGVIMFLRTGWVVGTAGLKDALLMLVIANVITLLTTLSLSAIASNTKVGVGGAYFLISRSLGLELGGSIGIPLFFAQAVSVAFYIVGFTESLKFLSPDINERFISLMTLFFFFMIARVGAALVVKTQYAILAVLVLSIISFFIGYNPVPEFSSSMAPMYPDEHSFWSVFAIFFPAVTGIMSGVSMSGDLKTPSRSIARGTLFAVVSTFFIYGAQMVWLAMNAERSSLISNKLVMQDIAVFPELILLGLWGATLSSALASLAAAPRTLQALGYDGVVPKILGKGFGETKEPRVGLVVTSVVAGLCIIVGDLDLIAPIITMFFLTTYAMINLVAGLERVINNPSYRPSIKIPWFLSVIGCIACLLVMLLINTGATFLALVVISVVYGALTRRRLQNSWGDIRSGIWFAVTRLGLLRFEQSRKHIRNWRPVMLVLVGNPKSRAKIIDFANWFESGIGFLFLAQIVVGSWEKLLPRQSKLQKSLQTFIQDNDISGVAKTVLADDFEHGVATLLQVSGLGQFKPDTVLVGWNDDTLNQAKFARSMRKTLELEKNLIIFSEAEPQAILKRTIDVWWYAKDNGSLMITLADLLKQNLRWKQHKLRLLRIINDEAGVDELKNGMQRILEELRINAEIEIIVSDENPLDIIPKTSQNSAVCFVGLSLEALEKSADAFGTYRPLVSGMNGNIFLTKSWHDLRY